MFAKRWPVYLFFLGKDILLSGLVASFCEDHFRGFFITLAILWGGGAVLGLWGIVSSWLGYWLIAKNSFNSAYLKEFRSNAYPDPHGEYDIDSYLAAVSEGEDVSQKVRIRAAVLWGEIKGFRGSSQFSQGLMYSMSAEAALKEFDRTYRPYQ